MFNDTHVVVRCPLETEAGSQRWFDFDERITALCGATWSPIERAWVARQPDFGQRHQHNTTRARVYLRSQILGLVRFTWGSDAPVVPPITLSTRTVDLDWVRRLRNERRLQLIEELMVLDDELDALNKELSVLERARHRATDGRHG